MYVRITTMFYAIPSPDCFAMCVRVDSSEEYDVRWSKCYCCPQCDWNNCP